MSWRSGALNSSSTCFGEFSHLPRSVGHQNARKAKIGFLTTFMRDEPYATCFNIIRFGRYLDVYSVRRNGHPYKGGFSLQILNSPYK